MKDDFLKMSFFVNGIAVGLWEKMSLKMQGDRIDLDMGGGSARKKITLEGKASAALRNRIRRTAIPLVSSGAPAERFDGVTFDVTIENRNGKTHLRWVNKAGGLEELQVLIAELMKFDSPGNKTGTRK